MSITHIYFDIGGVLGSNGWDHEQRAAAVAEFGLDGTAFERQHQEVVGMLEEGEITLDEYLDYAVFDHPRRFTREEFVAFMLAQSRPWPASLELARALARSGRYRLMTINNESAELSAHRVRAFGLHEIFVAFFTSCFVGAAKPSRRIYETALSVAQASPPDSVFIDDRPANLFPAERLGMHTIQFTNPDALRQELHALGVTI
ncbi:MAG TPA: HAD family phosphatase [Gemmatimonadaceae bacterium]|nr:HAD family phosphatase [Gemmatimonadaceae bacterium]